MRLVIFGANGPTGSILTKQALDAGHTVVAVTRHPEAFPLHHERLQVMRGDVLDLALVEQAVAGQDAVLSTIGAPFSRKPITVYSQGTANMIQAMNHHGVRRLVVVSSGATNPHHDPKEGFIFRRIIKPIVGRTLYADMSRMEAQVRESDLDWTIIRAALLFDTSTVTHYQVAQAYIVPGGRKTSRADLADFMLQQLTADEYVQKAVAIATCVWFRVLAQAERAAPSRSRTAGTTFSAKSCTCPSLSSGTGEKLKLVMRRFCIIFSSTST